MIYVAQSVGLLLIVTLLFIVLTLVFLPAKAPGLLRAEPERLTPPRR